MFTDKFLSEIEISFGEKISLCKNEKFLKKIDDILLRETEDVCQAFSYLYAAMPMSDMQDYNPRIFLEFARHGAFLYKSYVKEKKIPERIFAEYVLNHRVNNEDIVSHRPFFYRKLESYTQNKSMEEAVKDINFWCASKVTYRASDERTANPMTVYRAGVGRCGEESTFVVSLLRSVGIPARQVYVPLWSHCDDNHAWVEAWCDGEWKFFGACEPEGFLNHGWFFKASQRAMMVRSKSFLQTMEDEEHRKVNEAYEVTQTSRYALTKKICLRLELPEKSKKEGIKVRFQILNYAFFDDIAVAKTDKEGEVSLTMGLGSLLVTAFFNGYYGEMVIDTCEGDFFLLKMRELKKEEEIRKFILKAPFVSGEDVKKAPFIEEKEAAYYAQRLKEVTSERLKREGTFFDEKTTDMLLADFDREKADVLRRILKESRGNFSEIAAFLSDGDLDNDYKYYMLLSLSEKDYLDCRAEILKEHCLYTKRDEKYPLDIWANYLLNPRVSNERLKAYRKIFKDLYRGRAFTSLREIKRLWKELDTMISTKRGGFYKGLLLTGYEAILGACTDQKSKKIVMVQILRSLGFASRLHPVEGFIEVYTENGFAVVEESEEMSMDKALYLNFDGSATWQYLSNWSLSKFEGGRYRILENLHVDINDHKALLALSEGYYKLVTANRLPNGNIFALQKTFFLGGKEVVTAEVSGYEADAKQMLADNSLTDFALYKEASPVMLKSLAKDGPAILVWLEEKKEPTEHILNELWQRREKLKDLKIPWYFLVKGKEALKDSNISRAVKSGIPSGILQEAFAKETEKLARELYTEPGVYPLLLMMDKGGKGVYGVAGYNVGTVDMVIKLGEYLKKK